MTKINETLRLAGLIDEDGASAMASPILPGMGKAGSEEGMQDPHGQMYDRIMGMDKISDLMDRHGLDIDHLVAYFRKRH